MGVNHRIEKLKEIVEKEVSTIREKQEMARLNETELGWFCDFNHILLNSEKLDLVCDLFWECLEQEYPFQIGGSATSSISLVTGIIMKGVQKEKSTNGFFIRNSRSEEGLFKMVEGEDLSDEKIILVDNFINQGKSFIQQVEVLEKLGKKVHTIFVILRFRDKAYYEYFHNKGIEIRSLFTLDDFNISLATKNLIEKNPEPVPMPFKVIWYFKSDNPHYFYMLPKSAPVIDEERVYFGSDDGSFRSVNQKDGAIIWKYQIFFKTQRKKVFSSPVLCNNLVYFGAGDGNFYALNKETGKREWVYMDADWIESSPCVASSINTIFVGLEFGLWRKNGGIVALDLESGRKKWEYKMSKTILSSPAYSEKCGVVICGCDDFSVYAFDAQKGSLLWEFETKGEVKSSFVFSENHAFVVCGSFDKYMYVLKTKTGELIYKIKIGGSIYGTPLIYENFLYVTSLDKHLYCIDLKTGDILWQFLTEGKIFASPEVIENKIYIGSNDGRLYELDAKTGKNTALFQATEAITDKVAYNKKTGRVFLPTFANEIYCLSQAETSSL